MSSNNLTPLPCYGLRPMQVAARRCAQCGATVDVDENVLSTSCAFCDSPLVDVREDAEPVDRVAPFLVPRERAARLLEAHLAQRWFAPTALRRATRPDALDAVMVPFYAFSGVARTRFTAQIGLYWYRTETYTTYENGKLVTRTRQVRETEWFPLSGSHVAAWREHLVSASRGLSEWEANALEPFDLGRAVRFDPAHVAGLLAEHPTVPHDEAANTASAELSRLEKNLVAARHLPGDTHGRLDSESEFTFEPPSLLLLPVWVAAFQGPKRPVRLLVNGQTGEVVGVVPTSAWKVGLLVALIGILIAAAFAIAGLLTVGAMATHAVLGGG